MDSIIFEQPWSVGEEFSYGLISDAHIHPGAPNKALKKALDHCKEIGAKIHFNGDLADFITVRDPRYNKAADKARMAGIINEQIEYVVDFLMPYVNLIETISLGNHEDVLIKHYGIDVLRSILRDLNREKKNGMIHYGSYQGFMVYQYSYTKGGRKKSLTIFRHHGAGGSAPVTGGAIDLNRCFTNYEADVIWLGHKHKDTQRGEPLCRVNNAGNIEIKHRKGIMTPGFQKQILVDDNNANGGQCSFPDKFYGKSANGWGLLKVRPYNIPSGKDMGLDFTLTMMN